MEGTQITHFNIVHILRFPSPLRQTFPGKLLLQRLVQLRLRVALGQQLHANRELDLDIDETVATRGQDLVDTLGRHAVEPLPVGRLCQLAGALCRHRPGKGGKTEKKKHRNDLERDRALMDPS